MQGIFFEDLTIGQSAETTKIVGAADVEAFAAVSGDTNPVHLDEAYAMTTPFQGRIAHGMLSGAYISAMLGTKLPGPGAIYLTQSLRFRRPVKIGDPVVTRVTVQALDERRAHATLTTICQVDGKTVVDGEAVVMVPRRSTTKAD
ncbi:MAG: MaoC family dehydratase [Pseudomonadota bacterium]|uniref:MaoC family dehydratase n=1 Tax=Phenylobacterium sp. TaxID=1871053 RepID=UPI0027199401|nr:MaoC family dehydratase [Phenylobacterium sp.]MDO9431374.1 MaoC family dehydratase [Phenylobacterium sp.]